jgi:hypothetical protein
MVPTTDGEVEPFDPTTFGNCVAAAPGYSMGFDAAVRSQSINCDPLRLRDAGLTGLGFDDGAAEAS